MTHSSEIGFVASALVLVAFGMKDMINLRIVAICSNFAFIAYALVLNLPPVLVLHVILLPLNGWRLAQALQSSEGSVRGYSQASVNRAAVAKMPGNKRLNRAPSTIAPTLRKKIARNNQLVLGEG